MDINWRLVSICSVIGVVLIGALVWWTCFVPPFNQPVFENIENNQTGFLIPLDGDTASQAHFESVAYLKNKQVAAKRVQILRRWVPEGYIPSYGRYIETVRLIKVNRSPVIREWVQDPSKGTSKSDESIEAQSKDGTGLIIGFTVTALIPEETTAQFLYWYRGDSLNHIMDREFRARVTAVTTKFCVSYDLDHLRGHQPELVEAVEKDIIPFFATRGIKVTSCGMVGGFHYRNQQIQHAIDKTIQDQQLKVSAEARRASQEIENKTTILTAEGKKQAVTIAAEAQANAIKKVAEAKAFEQMQAVKDKQFYLTLRQIDLETKRLEKWDGRLPVSLWQSGTKDNGGLFLFPAPKIENEKK